MTIHLMKKLIAIVITLIFICESAGYGFDSLRKPLDFNGDKGSKYFCRMLALSIGVSMRKQMAKKLRSNWKSTLIIGEVDYTDMSQGILIGVVAGAIVFHGISVGVFEAGAVPSLIVAIRLG